MDDLKLYSKSENALDSLIQTVKTFSIGIGMQFGIDIMCHVDDEKGENSEVR